MENTHATKQRFVVAGIGELLWDMLPKGKQLGGAPANSAYHAHVLGHEAHVVSTVGDDALGRELCARIAGWGIDPASIGTDARHPTGTVSVALEQGTPTYTIHEDVAWDYIAESPVLDALAARADAVCFGSLAQRAPQSRRTIRRFLEATRADCLRVFDINLRPPFVDAAVIAESIPHANVLKLNHEELPFVARLAELEGEETQVCEALLEKYQLRLVALTRGPEGSVLFEDGEAHARPLDSGGPIVDTVGAGDSFTAAVISGLLRQHSLSEIHEHAARLAAYVCTQQGATPAVPEELQP